MAEVIETALLSVEVTEDPKTGSVHLKLTSKGAGKLAKAKLGVMPLPLKLNVKDGTKLSFTVERTK